MALRDRVFTPRMAKVILSPWRIVVGVVAAVVLAVLGVNVLLAILAGLVVYVVLVAVSVPRGKPEVRIDPFAVGEPWRHHVQGALKARRRFQEAVASAPRGAQRARLDEIGARLQVGVEQCWEIAVRGDQIDAAVTRLQLPSARSDLELLRARPADAATAATIASLQSQIESGERLKARSADIAQRLRLMEVRLSELATRAAEVAVGAGDEAAYGNDVDDLIAQLEGMRLAIDETEQIGAPPRVDFGTTEPPGTVSPADG